MIFAEEHYIYGLLDPNTKELRYVGFSSNIDRRYIDHHRLCMLKEKTHKNDWIKSLLKNGQQAELFIIEEHSCAEDLPQAEIDMIAYYRSIGCDLTNATDGGENPPNLKGRTLPQEWRDNMSKALKGRVSPNKGKVLSEEYRAAISEGSMGKPGTNTGKTFSDEWKENMSKARKGKPNVNGRKFSAEQESEMERLYIILGKSVREIGKIFECSKSTILHILRRNKVKMRPTQTARKIQKEIQDANK